MTRWTRTGMARAALGAAACAALLGADRPARPVAAERPGRAVSVRLPDGVRVEIGRVAAGPSFPNSWAPGSWLIGAALAQGAALALDDLTLTFGATVLKAPRVEVQGSALSQGDLRALLDGGSAEPWRTRLQRLSARAVVIPVLRVEQPVAERVQVAVYHDVVARDVVQGRIGTLEAGGATLSVEGGGPAAGAGAYGRLTARELDLAGLARLLTEAGGPEAAPIRVYGAVTAEDIALTGPDGATVRIARIEGRDLGGRPTATPWGEAARALAAGDPGRAEGPERARLSAAAADLLDGVSVGSLEFGGVTVTSPGAGAPTRVGLALLSYRGEPGAGAPGAAGAGTVRAEGLTVEAPAGRFALKGLTLAGLSLKPTLEGLRRSAAGPLDPREVRQYAPLVGRVVLDGLDVALSAEAAGDPLKPDTPVQFGLRGGALEMSEPRNGIPTASRLTLEGFTCAVPAQTEAPVLADLAALGYGAVDLSGVVDSRWNEGAQEVALREVTLSGKDMGTARITGTIGGIGRDVFDPDAAVSSLAILGASAKALSLTLENGGLFQRFVDQQAKAQSLKPEELQREYGTAAMLGIPAVLGNSPDAKALGQAVARFVVKPGRLSVNAAAKDPSGLGIVDFSSAGSPGKLFDRLTVTATAE
ncbi:hypothetical protein [Methylobacterium crusticola]|uniref:hypothetical protein n=1 Tax=Methylobacterium crusticola TaxID=1697972 RepID=UPI000FFC1928|nr:hypothetical protein [Methylobacterium crusticola]